MTETDPTLAAPAPLRTPSVGGLVAYGEPAAIGFLLSLPVFELAFGDRWLAHFCATGFAAIEVVESWWKIRRARRNPETAPESPAFDPPHDSARMLGQLCGRLLRCFLLVYVIAFVITRDHEFATDWALVLGTVLAIREMWHERRRRLLLLIQRRALVAS